MLLRGVLIRVSEFTGLKVWREGNGNILMPLYRDRNKKQTHVIMFQQSLFVSENAFCCDAGDSVSHVVIERKNLHSILPIDWFFHLVRYQSDLLSNNMDGEKMKLVRFEHTKWKTTENIPKGLIVEITQFSFFMYLLATFVMPKFWTEISASIACTVSYCLS